MKLFFSCILLCCCLQSNAQHITNVVRKNLLHSSSIQQQRLLILIDTDSITVVTTFAYLSYKIKSLTKQDTSLALICTALLKKIKADSLSTLKVNEVFVEAGLMERYNFLTGDILSAGQCAAFNKFTKRRIKQVKIVSYGGYSYGATGKQYFSGNTLLLDNTEIVF
ncbi:hypothetical protein [Ferruginibacter profundus]